MNTMYFTVEPSDDPFYADPVRGIFLEETTILETAIAIADEAGPGTRVVRRDLDVDAQTIAYTDVYVAPSPVTREERAGAAWADREASCLMDQGIRAEGPWTCGDDLALALCELTDEDERHEEAERINAAARARWNELVASYA